MFNNFSHQTQISKKYHKTLFPLSLSPSGYLQDMATKLTKSNTQEQTLPWIEKHRPKNLSDLVAHEQIISTSTRFSDSTSFNSLFYDSLSLSLSLSFTYTEQQTTTTTTVERLIESGKLPHLLFYGPPGTLFSSAFEDSWAHSHIYIRTY